jgi:hypothetical protein
VGRPARPRLPVDGLYVGLGIGGYSARSQAICEDVRRERGARLHVVDLAETYGYTTPTGAQATGRSDLRRLRAVQALRVQPGRRRPRLRRGRSPATTSTTRPRRCSATSCAGRTTSSPAAARAAGDRGQPGPQVKPLYRLSEREMAAYCVVRGIDYVVEECPLVDGNTGHELKAALDLLERLARAQGPVPVRLPRPPRRWRSDEGDEVTRARRLRTVRHADHRRGLRVLPQRERILPPAAASRRSRDPVPTPPRLTARRSPVTRGPRAARHRRAARRGRAGRADRPQAAALPRRPRAGWRVAQPRRPGPARRPDRRGEGTPSAPTATWRWWCCGRRARTSS